MVLIPIYATWPLLSNSTYVHIGINIAEEPLIPSSVSTEFRADIKKARDEMKTKKYLRSFRGGKRIRKFLRKVVQRDSPSATRTRINKYLF